MLRKVKTVFGLALVGAGVLGVSAWATHQKLGSAAHAGQVSKPPVLRMVHGAERTIEGSKTFAYAMVDEANRPHSIGVSLDMSLLDSLSEEGWSLDLELPAGLSGMVFDHVGLDWVSHGHEPPGIYDKPHFDMHFYILSRAQREGITAVGDDLARVNKQPAPEHIPQGYVAIPGGVPHMGAHWYNPAAPEFHGQPFTHSFIYGFYDGKLAFHEVMVARDFLKSMESVEAPLAMPQAFEKPGLYPSTYSIQYDTENKRVLVLMQGMKESQE